MTSRPRHAAAWGLALLLLGLCWAPDVYAQDRLVRRFAGDQGLPVPPVWALAQDRAGFLWIGTQGGLYRYDGVEFRRWTPDQIAGSVFRLAVATDGRVAGQMSRGTVFEIRSDSVIHHAPPPGGWPTHTRTLAFDEHGRLWSVAAGGRLVYRADSAWSAIPLAQLAEERAHEVRAAADGGVYALTNAGLWHIEAPGAEPRKRFDAVLADLLSLPDGRLILLTTESRVLEVDGDRVRELASREAGQIPAGRPIALAERNGTIWVSLDRYLIAIRSGQPVEVIGSDDGIESGGSLLVDDEGSLWLGSFTALFQYPEPETVIWNDDDGLPSRHTRYVARAGSDVLVTTWQGTGRVRPVGTGFAVSTVPELWSQTRPCVDSSGSTWLSTTDAVVRLKDARIIDRLPPEAGFNGCAGVPGSGLWIGTDQGLLYADGERGTIRRVTGLPFGDSAVIATVFRDRGGRLWTASGERVCHAPAAAVLRSESGDWECDAVPGAGNLTSFAELPDGTLWASTRRAGVLWRGRRGWRPIDAAADLPSRDVFALVPSPSGGVWVVGHGILLRVRPTGPDDWDVLEAPGPRNGLASIGGGDLLEDDDGTLWITTALGLVRVPPRARFISLEPPRVSVTDARVGTEPVPLDRPLELPSDQNRLELRFAALSFREPGRVRYQVRLAPDAPWIGTRGQPWFRWIDLPPGRYHAEVRASLDGRSWSGTPARFVFRVLPPWYLTPWALAGFALLAVGVLWAAYHTRLAFLLGLERQRTRIAMDLHDELGSGLGSMGILAGLLADGRLGESQRRQIAGEVAGTAAELGSALSDIVWSLDRRTATLEELAARLAGHAERFFAGDGVAFTMRPPDAWPPVRMPLPLRRNVLLIGLEALHNAARHARAARVTLGFTPRGGRWELSVTDDGVGLGSGEPRDTRRGRGLAGMRRRADEIGATIEWRETAGGGTTVVLRFALPSRAAQRISGLRARLGRRRPRRGRMA